VNQESRTDKSVVHLVIAQDVANILAKKTFDTFPKLLHPIDVGLLHSPRAISRVRRTRLERFDFLFYSKIPGDIGDQILKQRERFNRLNRYRPIERQIAQAGHAHQFWQPVYFRRARTALARFAVPSTGQIVRLGSLNLMDGVQHHHTFGTFGRVILKSARVSITAPDFENSCFQ
jgi:hypothetical protein